MIVITILDIRPGRTYGIYRLPPGEEEMLQKLFSQAGEKEKQSAVAEAIASVVANSAAPAGAGVIIWPGVPAWAIRAVAAALEKKGFIPFCYDERNGEIIEA